MLILRRFLMLSSANTPWFCFLIFAAALIQAALGFGFTPVTMAFLPNMLDYSKAVAVSLAVIFVSTLILSIRYRKYVRWKILLPLLIPTFIFNGIAAFVSTNLSSGILYLLLGFMLIAIAVFFFVFSDRIRLQPSVRTGVILGSLCGICYGFFAIGGPTAALYLMPSVEDKTEYMGSMQMFLCINNALGIVLRIARGAITTEDLPVIGIGWIFMLIGTFAGLILFKKLSKELFRKVIYAFVGINGLWIVIQHFIG